MRPVGVVASSALVLGGAVAGIFAIEGQIPVAHAVEAQEAETAAATDEDNPRVTVDGETIELDASANTLGEALRKAGVVVTADDVVSAELGGPVPVAEVTIKRVATQTVTDQKVDAHGTSEVPDPNLPKGERRVTTPGVDGVTQVVSRVTLENGAETAREEIARVSLVAKVDEVVAVGTNEAAAAAAAAYGPGTVKGIAAQMVATRGWGGDQMQCLDKLWQRESNWNHTAQNPSSGAYGIPQSLPGNKMASAGADWRTNPATQISWGLGYIADRYGSPCGAWGHSQARGWY